MRRRRRLPKGIERELAKLLGTLGFGDYADFLWGLPAKEPNPPPAGLKAAILRQIREQARHDPGVVAAGEAALPNLRQRIRSLHSLCGVSARKLLDGIGTPPAAILVAARLDPQTNRRVSELIEALRGLGATSFMVVVTDESEAARSTQSLDRLEGVRLLFWCDRFDGNERTASRHFALLVHAIGAPIVISLQSRLGLGTIGLYGRALKTFHRLYAVLDAPIDKPFTDIYHLRQTAPHATILAMSQREAEMLQANFIGLRGPGIETMRRPDQTFGMAFDDLRSDASRTAYATLLGCAAVAPSRAPNTNGQFDVTVTIVFHRERELSVPALASLHDMIEAARRDGVRVESRAMLDNADELTRLLIAEHGTFLDDVHEVSFGDLAKVRNAGTALARGRFLTFLDGDDLWGDGWLIGGYRAASAAPQVIWHPEALFMFYASDCDRAADPWTQVLLHQSSDAAGFEPRDLLFENQWSANAFAHREIFERFPYRPDDWSRQIGIEDWRWNLDTLGHGIAHLVVPETVHLIRLKEAGSLGQLHETKASLPFLD